MHIETLAVHSGHSVDSATGAVATPIHLSTTFEREADGSYAHEFVYSRSHNPNRHGLEQAIAMIEGGTEAAAFSSGTAATAAVFQALQPGDYVVTPAETYHGTRKLLEDVWIPWGVQAAFVDMTDLAAVENAIRPETKLIWIETPSNPQLKITDIAAVCRLAHDAGAVCVCDNTFAPIVQKPFEQGADLVVHSATKYFGGHSDVTGGAVVTRTASEMFDRIRMVQGTGGAVLAPFDSWLIHRGVQTLPWRVRAHCGNALAVATFLESHPKVERVHYPGLASDRGHQIAARQMHGFSGMLSFQVRGGREPAMAVAAKVKLFTRATSLGGVESLIEHRASLSGESPLTPPGLLRCSIGLEHSDDLINDLAQALG